MNRSRFLALKINAGSLTSSTSRWAYQDVTQFMKLQHVQFLGLQAPPPLPLASEVFARVPLDKNKLMNDPKPTTHVDLPNVLAQVGLFPNVPIDIFRQAKAGTLSEDDFLKYVKNTSNLTVLYARSTIRSFGNYALFPDARKTGNFPP